MEQYHYKNHTIMYHCAGNGRPLIFLHNGGSDHRLWEHQVQHFSGRYRVLALDLPGYGESDRPHIEYSLELYTDFLETFIRDLALDRPVIIGNCVGSATALRYTMRSSSPVRGLVLFNVLTEKTLSAGIFGSLYRLTSRSRLVERACRAISENLTLPAWSMRFIFPFMYGDKKNIDDYTARLGQLFAKKGQLRVLYSLLRAIGGFRELDHLEKPSDFPPVCIIWGSANRILPEKSAEGLLLLLKPDILIRVDRCGHFVMRENPARVNAVIDEFLNKTER